MKPKSGKSSSEGVAAVDEDDSGKMFVGGLSWETTQESLSAFFGRWGRVTDCVVMKNGETGRSRGFGFVTFSDAAIVTRAIHDGPHQLDGRTIDPKPCNPRSLQNRCCVRGRAYPKVFLGGLPASVTETELRHFFHKFGRVMEVVIMYDQEKRKSRGFGFLSFESQDSVERVVILQYITLSGKQVEVKRAEPRTALRANSQPVAVSSVNHQLPPASQQRHERGPHSTLADHVQSRWQHKSPALCHWTVPQSVVPLSTQLPPPSLTSELHPHGRASTSPCLPSFDYGGLLPPHASFNQSMPAAVFHAASAAPHPSLQPVAGWNWAPYQVITAAGNPASQQLLAATVLPPGGAKHQQLCQQPYSLLPPDYTAHHQNHYVHQQQMMVNTGEAAASAGAVVHSPARLLALPNAGYPLLRLPAVNSALYNNGLFATNTGVYAAGSSAGAAAAARAGGQQLPPPAIMCSPQYHPSLQSDNYR